MQQLPPIRCSATGEKVCTAGARRVVVERIPTFPPATDSGLADYDLQTATTDYLASPKGQWIGRRSRLRSRNEGRNDIGSDKSSSRIT